MKRTFAFLILVALMLIQCTTNVSLTDDTTWYEFHPANIYDSASLIGLEEWHSEPAGEYGRIEVRGDKLFYNNREMKLWGLNNTYGACAPDKEMADKRAAFYKKYGVNSVRLHKYADGYGRSGIQSEESFVQLEEEALNRMDYYVHALKESGIFVKLSPTFGVKIGPGDISRVPFHREIGDITKDKRIRATYGAVYLSEEIQDMQIEQTLNVLNHVNAYTGMKYADDPAIFCVELFNEDAVLWNGGNWSLERYPTIRKRTAQQFSGWLLEKYGSEENWRNSWGEEVIYVDAAGLERSALRTVVNLNRIKGLPLQRERLASGTVVPWSYPWALDDVMRPDGNLHALRQRLFDSAEFLTELQNAFYTRFVQAIRETGYEGEIVASNWQAGSTLGHLLNLHSDYQAGIVDRHNYFGGGNGDAFRNQKEFKDGSMLALPGKGTLSAGLQQVTDRPFMLSEWIHVQPNEYYAEGPAILGAYGWGLNGWDVSYMFQNNDNGGFRDQIIDGNSRWDVSNPAIMVNFPAVARQVRRLDVREAEESKLLNVHIPSLLEGKSSFLGDTEQTHDEKTFKTDKVPAEALAAVRVAVDFTGEFQDTPEFDMGAFMDGNTVVSATGELRWTPAPNGEDKGGYITVNTAATKAFIGFAPGGETFDLGDGYSITPSKGFAVIYLTAKGEEETLKSAAEIVVTAMARARNKGMEFNEEENIVLKPGGTPVVMEPVKAVVNLPVSGNLLVLDHDGNAITNERKFRKSFGIDGSVDQTPFYLIRR
ncbi:MAG: hypothetical protein PHS40_07440 [Mariniphaga sp.]|nr:hypothetical protein [Mariniphaga sp.]